MRTEAVLSLGGNLGDPARAMGDALRLLEEGGDEVRAVSALYRTPPWGPVEQPDFLNACAVLNTGRAPEDLLARCLEVERFLKRERLERWGPRVIDIDIVDMEGVVIAGPGLTLPHPRAHERGFVLVPLAEIRPDWILSGRAVAEHLPTADVAGIELASADSRWWRQSSAV